MSDRRTTVGAVQTSLDVVAALRDRGGAGVTELADELGIAKGTVHNHLSTLVENEYVVKSGGGTYDLSLRFGELADRARRRIDRYEHVRAEVDDLAERSGELAMFTIEEHGMGVCAYESRGTEAVDAPVNVGSRVHLHHDAAGKAILAHLPTSRLEEVVEKRGLPATTDRTITDPDALREELATVRERGVAFDRGERIDGLLGVAVPILTRDDVVRGAISVIGPGGRIDAEGLSKSLPTMLERSRNIVNINAASR